MPPRACHATPRCSQSPVRDDLWQASDPPTADHALGGHAHDQPRVARNADYLYRCSRRCRSATKLTYEECHGRSGSNSRLLSPLRLAARAALLDAHVFFLPCDAQTRDYLDEADLRDRARKRLGAVAAPRGACARARHRWLCHAVWQPVCLIGSCTGVPWPVWACAEARWSGDASPVDVPSRCVALCTVRGSQTRADRSIPV